MANRLEEQGFFDNDKPEKPQCANAPGALAIIYDNSPIVDDLDDKVPTRS